MARRGQGDYLGPASSGGLTQLHRVVDLVNSGHDPDSIKVWCEKEIRRLREFYCNRCGGAFPVGHVCGRGDR